MAGALADVTGVETIKTLVACLGVPDFTIDELARQAGVSRRTVDTVVRRYQHAFDRLPADKQHGPGRPPVRWRLRTDHLDEVLEAVGSHQSALGAGWRSQVADAPGPDTVESSLMMAATAITRTHGSDDPEQAKQLVAAARNSLAAAGFDSDGSPWTGHPDQELAGRARLIAAVADVVDSSLSGDQLRTGHRGQLTGPQQPDAAEQAIADACRQADETLTLVRASADEVLANATHQAEQITGDARARAESLERAAMDTAARVLTLAQQTVDQVLADARREADEILTKAALRAEQTVARVLADAPREATQTVDQVLADARREADEILIKARRQAEQVTGDARARAESLERDARERHRQAMGSLVQTREELERRVDDLRAFEREYRSRLKAYLEGQLRELEASATGGAITSAPSPEHRVDDLRAFEREYRSRLKAYLEGQLRDLEAGVTDIGTFPAIGSVPPTLRETPRPFGYGRAETETETEPARPWRV